MQRTATMRNNGQRRQPAKRRSAFSLLELMIVIIIIAILAGLLLVAAGGARDAARTAQVTVEIKNLEKAIADFKMKYGIEPPSRFRIHENGVWTTTDADDRASVAIIKQIWPNYQLVAGAGTVTAPNSPNDVNGNGVADTITLSGAECLVFFLGGILATADANDNVIVGPDGGGSGTGTVAKWSPIGFSANPLNPFARGGSRVGPFYEFDSARLQDVFGSNGFPEYLDAFPAQSQPLLYANSNDGRGYNLATPSDPTSNNPDFLPTNFATYRNSTNVPYNAKSFQIISPGVDGEYGAGGVYNGERSTNPSERDNITNFKGGKLN